MRQPIGSAGHGRSCYIPKPGDRRVSIWRLSCTPTNHSLSRPLSVAHPLSTSIGVEPLTEATRWLAGRLNLLEPLGRALPIGGRGSAMTFTAIFFWSVSLTSTHVGDEMSASTARRRSHRATRLITRSAPERRPGEARPPMIRTEEIIRPSVC